MGFGSTRKRRKIYFCSLRAQNQDKQTDPHFKVSYKKDDKLITQRETEISGHLFRLATGGYEYQGAPQKTIIVELIDNNEIIKLEANIESSMTRNIINCILGREPLGYDNPVFMRLYTREKDGVAYAAIFVGGEDAKNDPWSWKWKPEEISPLITKFYNPKIRKAGQQPGEPNDTDYSALNEMMLGQFEDLAKRINAQLALMHKSDSHDEEEEEIQTGGNTSHGQPESLPPTGLDKGKTEMPSPDDDLPF